ncbi:hypothetical protein KCU62_g7677, partial [Aureobasidium sp. EXF-3399]
MAVQAASFVTVVKTIVYDRAVSGDDASAAALDNEFVSEQAKISRRDEDDSLGDPSVTKICITSPATTCLDLTLTDGLKPQDTSTDNPDDDGTWEEYIPPPTPTSTVPQPPDVVITRIHTTSGAGPPARNSGTSVTHSKEPEVYTTIPDWWPPSVGPNVDPNVERPRIPEIINPGWKPKPTPEPATVLYCDVFPRPDQDPECTRYGRSWTYTGSQLIARATSVMN